MSARDLLLPDRALAGVLAKTFRSIDYAEKNFRFPGAVRFEELVDNTGPIGLVLGLAANNLITMTLDRGRWFLVGGTIFLPTSGTFQTWDLNLAFVSSGMPYPDVRAHWEYVSTSRTVPMFRTHSLHLDSATAVTLQARAFASGAGSVNVAGTGTYLIAVPV